VHAGIWRYYVSDICLSFVIGLLIAIPVSGMLLHELGHLTACGIFGLKIISYSPTQVVHASSSNPSVNAAVGFAGGLTQAMSCFAFVLIISLMSTGLPRTNYPIEIKLRNWSIAIGLETGFLTVGFTGFVIAFWEGFYTDSYDYFADNTFVWVTITFISALAAFLILYKAFPAPTESDHSSSRIIALHWSARGR
jgi:hypothetical protein